MSAAKSTTSCRWSRLVAKLYLLEELYPSYCFPKWLFIFQFDIPDGGACLTCQRNPLPREIYLDSSSFSWFLVSFRFAVCTLGCRYDVIQCAIAEQRKDTGNAPVQQIVGSVAALVVANIAASSADWWSNQIPCTNMFCLTACFTFMSLVWIDSPPRARNYSQLPLTQYKQLRNSWLAEQGAVNHRRRTLLHSNGIMANLLL